MMWLFVVFLVLLIGAVGGALIDVHMQKRSQFRKMMETKEREINFK